jgi:DNA-binding beta-propeller fold protein YncE
MTRDGSNLFVANGGGLGGGSVTELATSTGAPVRVMAGSYYHLDDPSALAVYGGYLFVANAAGNSVSVIDVATGELAKYLSGPAYGFAHPDAISVAGGHLFVLNGGPGFRTSYVPTGSVTELDASSGALVRAVSGRQYRF